MQVLLYVLMSPAGCYTDFHVDFGGSSIWYHVVKGRKTFILAPPTPQNMKAFEEWSSSDRQVHLTCPCHPSHARSPKGLPGCTHAVGCTSQAAPFLRLAGFSVVERRSPAQPHAFLCSTAMSACRSYAVGCPEVVGVAVQGGIFYADRAEGCLRATLNPGSTLLIPSSWPHAVVTQEDAMVVGGNFLHALELRCISQS